MSLAPHTAETDQTAESLLAEVRALAAELHPRRRLDRAVTLDSSLSRDLGLDSLARVELLARIGKRFGRSFPDDVFAVVETPRDLLQVVAGAPPAAVAASTVSPAASEPSADEILTLPAEARTLLDVVEIHARSAPNRVHIRFYDDAGDGETLTYGALRDGALAVAAHLQRLGLHRGEAAAILLPTGKDYFLAYLGILLAGGIPVPIYPPARRSQIEDHLRRHGAILRNCEAAVMIVMPEAKLVGQALKLQVESLRHLVTMDDLPADAVSYTPPRLSGDDIAFLQYTSGSTGNPKGVVLTHANLLANVRAIGEAVRVAPDDVVVSWLPLYHDMGLIGAWMCSLYFGVPLVLMSPLTFLGRPERWLRAISRWRGTISAAPNFAYELCLKRIADEDLAGIDLSSWRVACNGAEPVSPDTLEHFCARFAPQGFRRETMMPVYGLAECSVGLAFPPLDRGPWIDRVRREVFVTDGEAVPAEADDPTALAFVACGRPLPGHAIRILDDDGREVPERIEGRLQFQGPSATRGYYRNAEATAALLADDGWLESGDRAYLASGDVFITGRKKDVIIRAGRNIYPHELEEAAGALPGIRAGNVAVFGIADPDQGTERLIVVAETRETDRERLAALRADVDALAIDLTGAGADEVLLVPPGTVLKTSSGKIRRAGNKELYLQGHLARGRASVGWQMARIALAGVMPEVRRLRRALRERAYARWAWLAFWLVAPPTWAFVMLAPHLSQRWAAMRAAARLLGVLTGTPFTVTGAEHLRQPGPCVYVANHASYIDAFVAVAALPTPCSFVAKAELTQGAMDRLFLTRIGTQFVERFDRQKGIADAGRIAEAARAGQSLFFFAEGTFTSTPGLLPFAMGAFLAAAEADVPVVPLALKGTRSILLGDTDFPRRGRVDVAVGPPIYPAEARDPDRPGAWATALALREKAREFILAHCGEPDLAEENSPLLTGAMTAPKAGEGA